MSTVFIAVQCFQCSTMQVKQRKKSSNKWNCVICNEKQSVRKVFSQACMAKDVRKFVQTFNMSRQFTEQQQEQEEEETLTLTETENQPNKKRTDWSDYIDPHINDFDDETELCEPNVVTELPKPLFKKPKLRNYYSASGLDGGKLLRPVFVKKKFGHSGKERGTTVKGDMKTVGDDQHGIKDAGPSSVMLKLKRPVSKWDDFVDDGDEGRCEEINRAAFETKVSDEIVEDDVHPDFM